MSPEEFQALKGPARVEAWSKMPEVEREAWRQTRPRVAPGSGPQCKTCDKGTLVRQKTHRMSGPVAAIGYILLVPSILGLLIGCLLLFGVGKAVSDTAGDSDGSVRARMEEAAIPEDIISNVTSGNLVIVRDLMAISEHQREVVRLAKFRMRGKSIGTGAGVVMFGGVGGVVVVASFVGGLLGWLLVMKKTVLKCNSCGAVVAAG